MESYFFRQDNRIDEIKGTKNGNADYADGEENRK